MNSSQDLKTTQQGHIPPSIAVDPVEAIIEDMPSDLKAEAELSNPNISSVSPEPEAEADQLPGVYAEKNLGHPFLPPMKYRILPEPYLTQTLEKLANPISHPSPSDPAEAGVVTRILESVSFQPCLHREAANQDRHTMAEWRVGGKGSGKWRFVAVFDGHGGHETSEYTVKELPKKILKRLEKLYHPAMDSIIPEGDSLIEQVSSILQDSIIELDNQLLDEFRSLFSPESTLLNMDEIAKKIENMSIEEIKEIVNGQNRGGKNQAIMRKIMSGTTALIGLMDPAKENLWISNLGDCQATLVKSTENGETFEGELITQNHNIDNPKESDRVILEHPGEKNVVVHNSQTGGRVLGAIMVSRALGDFIFKFPQIITRKVILNASPGPKVSVPIESYLDRMKTPPYVSNISEIHHRTLGVNDRYLILSSDGLSDLYSGNGLDEVGNKNFWARVVGNAGKEVEKNKALELLRASLGGGDEEKLSSFLTLEMDGRWMDDTTILVMNLKD